MPGTIDFTHDFTNDLVIARPRWTLDSPREVARWYELQARYFKARFGRPKDLVVVNTAFAVAPEMGTLWTCYSVKLHEALVRHSVNVQSSQELRRTASTSVVRYCISSVEAGTVEEAIAVIQALREGGVSGGPASGAVRLASTSLPAQAAGGEPKR